jgi:hypothetical protein
MKRVRRSTHPSGKPRRSRNTAAPIATKPPKFTPGAAICVLWAVTTPVPTRLDQKGFEWSVIVHESLDDVGKELVHTGILEKVRGPRAGSLWVDAYQLAPLQRPLDQRHSATVKQITDAMLKHPECHFVKELRSSGVVTKLLGGVYHPNSASRMLHAEQFLNR